MTFPRRRRDGQVLVEFALIALVVYFLLAVILDFGRATYGAQVLQQAADVIAQELSRTPLPADLQLDLTTPIADPAVKAAVERVYSEDFLALNVTGWDASQTSLADFVLAKSGRELPVGNQLLMPLMVMLDHAQNDLIPAGQQWLVYPGALVPRAGALTGFTVRIPTVTYPSEGVEVIGPQTGWLPVVQLNSTAFSITSTQRGMVALRVNFPFQAAGLTGQNAGNDGPQSPQGAYIAVPAGEELQPGQVGGPYSGPTGLGRQAAFAKTVRPFRRVLSAQGIYRREVFLPPSSATP